MIVSSRVSEETTRKHNHLARRAIVIGLLLAGLIVIVSSDVLIDPVNGLVQWTGGIIEQHPVRGAAVFLLLSAISAMIAFFSTAIVVPIAVFAWGELTTCILLWGGWFLGGIAAYAIGRFLGHRIVALFVDDERLAYYERRISRHARFPLVLLFQLAVPSELPGYLLGIMGYRFTTYLVVLALGELPFAIGAVYLGRGVLHRDLTLLLIIGAAGLTLSTLALHFVHKRTLEDEGIEGSPPGPEQ